MQNNPAQETDLDALQNATQNSTVKHKWQPAVQMAHKSS
jgi:hypothetical protein